jgi:16S rRNA (adenine1518-N6/adenine1519-N6)-dimethyltransferase
MKALPRARKRFGQHFLVDPTVLERIAAAVAPRRSDSLLEIGPGPGALTEHLYGRTERYVAVELDRDLLGPLKSRFPDLTLIGEDILRVDLGTILEPPGWRVVGNLPYNISSPLLLKLFEHLGRIEDMHFMFQRELAARLAACPGGKSWGRLGVITQYHCEVDVLFEVPPEAFAPPPKVHSALVRLVPLRERLRVDRERLDLVLRLAFSARRKRIANGLKRLHIEWDLLDLDPNARPDVLGLEDFVALANAVRSDGSS